MQNSNQKSRGEPEDIFENLSKQTPRPAPKPKRQQPVAPAPIVRQQSSRPRSKSWLAIVIVLVVVLFLGFGAYVIMTSGILNKKPQVNQQTNTTQSITTTNEAVSVPSVNAPSETDTDSDGLSDEEEKTLGTNVSKSDTDNDGLFDREEVKVYKSDPLKPDTDSDGVSDGKEVQDGTDPNGPGKLLDLPREIEKLTNQ